MRERERSGERAFTLVEAMVVVVVVGILATIAFVGYRRYVTAGRMLEGTSMIEGIVVAQERYKAESGTYAHINDPNACWYPRPPGRYVTMWGGPCDCCKSPWATLGVSAHGPVAFGFGSSAGRRSTDPSDPGPAAGMKSKPAPAAFFPGDKPPALPPPKVDSGPWFLVAAIADFDGNPAVKTTMVYDSDVKVIATANDGE